MTRKLFEEYDLTVAELNKENQELKLELSGYRQAILNNKEMLGLKEQNQKLNGTIQTYDILLKANTEENKQLKDNWNYIKKMLKEVRQEKFNVNGYCGTCTDVDIDFLLNKMQELEKGCDSHV